MYQICDKHIFVIGFKFILVVFQVRVFVSDFRIAYDFGKRSLGFELILALWKGFFKTKFQKCIIQAGTES